MVLKMIQFLEEIVAIPEGTTPAQWNQIKRAIDYGKTKNVHVEITEVY